MAQELAEKIKAIIRPWKELQELKEKKTQLGRELADMEKKNQFVSSEIGRILPYIVIGVVMLFAVILAISQRGVGWFIFGLIASLVVFLYYLLKYRNIPSEYARLKEEHEKTLARIKKIRDEYDFEIVPGEYRYEDAMQFFCRVLRNHRAYTLQEAINLYEDELHKRQITQMHEAQLANQSRQLAELQEATGKSIQDVSFDDVISAGSVIAAGVTIAKLAKFVKNNLD